MLSDDPTLWIPRFTGHAGRVNTVAWRPDGSALASGSYDRTGALWDLTGRQSVGQAISGHGGAVMAVAAAGDALVTARSDGTVAFREGETLAVTAELTLPGPVRALAAEPSGSLVAAGVGRAVTVWDADERRRGRELGCAGPSGRARVVGRGRPDRRDREGEGPGDAHGLGPVRPGRRRAVGSRRGARPGWRGTPTGGGWRWSVGPHGFGTHTAAKPPAAVLARTDAALLAAAFTADGGLLTGAYSGAVDRWDVGTGRRQEVAGTGADPVVGLAVSADGSRAAAVTLLGDTQLVDVDALRVVGEEFVGGFVGPAAFEGLPNGGEIPFNAQFLDNDRVATAGVDMGAGSAKVWDVDPDRLGAGSMRHGRARNLPPRSGSSTR